jgi:hypothetical protein
LVWSCRDARGCFGMVNMRCCFLYISLLSASAFAPVLNFGYGSAHPSCDKVSFLETASFPTLASSRRCFLSHIFFLARSSLERSPLEEDHTIALTLSVVFFFSL